MIKPTPTSSQRFPNKLHQMLSHADAALAISWNEDGTAFNVLDRLRLEHALCQFKMSSVYRSFQRQLNLYGFRSTARGLAHPFFHRDRPADCQRITRQGGAILRELGSVAKPLYEPDGVLNPVNLIRQLEASLVGQDQQSSTTINTITEEDETTLTNNDEEEVDDQVSPSPLTVFFQIMLGQPREVTL